MSLLKESPDYIQYKNPKTGELDTILSFDENEARSFGYYNNEFKIASKPRIYHSRLFSTPDQKIYRLDLEYPGRLWIKAKIISFWSYPENINILNRIIKDINKNNTDNFKIDDSWMIDIIVDDKGKYLKMEVGEIIKNLKPKDNVAEGLWNFVTEEYNNQPVLVSIKNYMGSKEVSDEKKRMSHIITPLLKNKYMELSKEFGSNHPTYKKLDKKNISSSEYKHKKTKYMYTEKKHIEYIIKKIIFEELKKLQPK